MIVISLFQDHTAVFTGQDKFEGKPNTYAIAEKANHVLVFTVFKKVASVSFSDVLRTNLTVKAIVVSQGVQLEFYVHSNRR